MFRLTKASISHSNLSTMVTCEHVSIALSSTYLNLISGDEEPRYPGRSRLTAPGPAAPEDSEVGIASPGAVLPGIPRPVPHTPKS
jgi:hypothetical protein